MVVTQLINARGNAVKNHIVMTDFEKGTITLQSYDSIVCVIATKHCLGFDKVVTFSRNWNYSNTTKKHLFEFLRQNDLEILASSDNITDAIERGYARLDEAIAAWQDNTLK